MKIHKKDPGYMERCLDFAENVTYRVEVGATTNRKQRKAASAIYAKISQKLNQATKEITK
jgi:hypothetical protein